MLCALVCGFLFVGYTIRRQMHIFSDEGDKKAALVKIGFVVPNLVNERIRSYSLSEFTKEAREGIKEVSWLSILRISTIVNRSFSFQFNIYRNTI